MKCYFCFVIIIKYWQVSFDKMLTDYLLKLKIKLNFTIFFFLFFFIIKQCFFGVTFIILFKSSKYLAKEELRRLSYLYGNPNLNQNPFESESG